MLHYRPLLLGVLVCAVSLVLLAVSFGIMAAWDVNDTDLGFFGGIGVFGTILLMIGSIVGVVAGGLIVAYALD